MAENTAYFENISAARSIAQFTEDEPGSLEGSQLLSMESDASQQEQDIFVYVHENFGKFLELTKLLKTREREMLLAYYVLRKTQNELGPLFSCTQTICSFNLRLAVKVLACYIMFDGVPTAEQTRPV